MKRSGNGGSKAHKAYQVSCLVVAVISTIATIALLYVCIQTVAGSEDYLHFFGGLIHE